MTRRLLFIHGAGGGDDDRSLADGLASLLDADLTYPLLPDEDMSPAAWASPIRTHLHRLGPDDVLVAHSFGASVLLQVLAETATSVPVRRATLLAMPNFEPVGWDVPEYAFDGPEPDVELALHHCADDEVVEFGHLTLNAARLPSATVHRHTTGGHQFDGLAQRLATIIG
ncbi:MULTISPECIES: alpha/beta fold hydrolase [Gordonia]|jgi:predicted alpha/beta hydrolase family esterase|uniref:alpha/beta fold hydrolase n=1 Tax=Gordonia TaxID=2053 RepID=UPI0032B525D8